MYASGQGAGHRQRLKDRFLKSSLQGFHDYEVLELLLTYAIPRRDVKPLAKKLLADFKGLKGVFEADPIRLRDVSGLGEASIMLLGLVKEAARAYLSEQVPSSKEVVSSPRDAVSIAREASEGDTEDGLYAFFLNSKNEVLGVEVIHRGTVEAGVSPKAVIQKAFSHNARSVIMVHLKQGKCNATKAEKSLANELEAAASSIDILVHDYIVAGSQGHVSAREMGWLKRSVYS